MIKKRAKKIIKKETPLVKPKTDEILGHILQNHEKRSSEGNKIAENHMEATAHGNKLLENNVEASGQILDEHKKTNEHLADLPKKGDVQKMTIVPPDEEEDPEASALMKMFMKLLRGPKGEKGDKHTDEELIALIKPLIPAPLPGDKGEGPTDDDLLRLIRPLIPKVKDGETPTDEKLLSLIKPLVDAIEVKEGEDGDTPTDDQLIALIKKVMPKPQEIPKFKYPTAEELVAMIKGKITWEHIAGKPNFDTFFRPKSSKTVSLSELDDVDLTGFTKSAAGKYKPNGGSSANFVDEEQVSGTGTSWVLASTPVAGSVKLTANGQRLTIANGDFTIVGKNITTALSFSTGALFADYRT